VSAACEIRLALPPHLRTLARVDGEVRLAVAGSPPTLGQALDALEARYPVLRGTIRDHATHRRRPFVRFFACREDLSHLSPDAPLPDAVCEGREPFVVLGALAGG
jgi:hypothetical protein